MMMTVWYIFVFVLAYLGGFACQNEDYIREIVKEQYGTEKWLGEVDHALSEFNSLAAQLMWKLSTNPDIKTMEQARQLGKVRNIWKNKVCDSHVDYELISAEQKRKIYLLCRGPRYSEELSDMYLTVMSRMSEEYNAALCLSPENTLTHNFTKNHLESDGPLLCVHGEPDLERLMKRTDLTSKELKWIWEIWHNHTGPRIKELFRSAVFYQNLAAQANGYSDMGQIWKEELEIPNLEEVVKGLYEEIKPLYTMLHAAVRHKLQEKYGVSEISSDGPIPVHLLGNMWGQNWSPLIDLFVPPEERLDLSLRMKAKGWNVEDIVTEAEDFYISLGMPMMTQKFWENSVFEQQTNSSMCHGSAANMYKRGDYRMLLCAEVSMEDLYVIHHEMGHIEYYMAYESQPAIFQDGTNSAFHESIGDAIMNGVLTPQHLQRLGLISDEELLEPTTELFILFQQALAHIPEIPFALMIDRYRWDIFSGKISYEEYNKKYWELNKELRGLIPPGERSERWFDAGAKFHIPDNTPYIRYFFSSILQMDIFKTLCHISIYGETTTEDSEIYPLHRCDIYGAKRSGKHLFTIMEQGSSITFQNALNMLKGTGNISAKSLLEYYRPVYKWLEKYIEIHKIHVGW